MFDFVGRFFKGRPKAQPMPAKTRTASKAKRVLKGVSYDSGLITNLKDDHELLVEIYGKVWSDGFEKLNYPVLSGHLAEFKGLFQSHLLKENVKFYAYLEQAMKKDPHSLGVVKEFRRDMNDIANAVIGFCKKYESPDRARSSREAFQKEYEGIGQALVRRVQLEERDLYSLYGPQ